MSIPRQTERAFTLMEVMIAVAIFFVAIAAVLQLMAQGLKMARSLQQEVPSPAFIAAELAQYSTTNILEHGGALAGDFSFLSSELYADYSWDAQTFQVASNGLFQADILVRGQLDSRVVERRMSILLFSPNSAVSGFGSVQ